MLMKVYIVRVDMDYKNWEIAGVYDSREKAEERISKYKGFKGEYGMDIQEWEIK